MNHLIALIGASPISSWQLVAVDIGRFPEIRLEDSGWTIAVAVGTILSAAATGVLAFFTHRLAIETRSSLAISRQALEDERAARADDERRHQDGFSPHVAIVIKNLGPITSIPGGKRIAQFMNREVRLRNIGVGPALNMRASVEPISTSIAKSEECPAALATADEAVIMSGSFVPAAVAQDVRIKIVYDDVFGRSYCSEYEGSVSSEIRYDFTRLDATRSANVHTLYAAEQRR